MRSLRALLAVLALGLTAACGASDITGPETGPRAESTGALGTGF